MQYENVYDDAIEKIAKPKITTFFSQKNPFSQWHPSVFSEDGFYYISAEQRMMIKKSELFNCTQVTAKLKDISNSLIAKDFIEGKIDSKTILSNKSPSKYINCSILKKYISEKELKSTKTLERLWSKVQFRIKSFGREVKPYIDAVWAENREDIVFDTSFLKYSQNDHLFEILMNTHGTILVEAAKNDSIWGVGMDSNNPFITIPFKWKGLNLLGKSLTNLRYYFFKRIKN